MTTSARARTRKQGPARAAGSSAPEAPRSLANRLCPDKSDGAVEVELVPAAGRRLDRVRTMAQAIDRVAAVIEKTCQWGEPFTDWHVGDYRFLVLSFTVSKDVGFYVQFWTEPEEPLLIEACSGAWNPSARPFIGAPQRAALRRLGYRVGGRARNYQKHWTLSPMAGSRALASELLTVLIDVFGYRGNRPLMVTYCSEGRTTSVPVFPGMAIDDVKRMLRFGGCRVVAAEPAGPVSRRIRNRLIHVDQPFPFVVEMRGQTGRTPAMFEAMRFITALPGGSGISSDQIETLVRECPFGRVFRDGDGEVLFVLDLVAAGTSARWFLTTLHVWKQTRERALAMMRLMLAPTVTGVPGAGDGPEDGVEPDDGDFEEPEEDEGGPRQAGRSRVTVH